uniref:Mothers against decapentaplegic homolog n=1 Tax=Neogobius melanostomus TaxID=47308 RepID=A0A8C6UIU6_9GOBI
MSLSDPAPDPSFSPGFGPASSSPGLGSDPVHGAVHSLLRQCQAGESEGFARRAIESLVRKLRERRDELEALVTAVTTRGTSPGCFVPVHLQRRLQLLSVAGRKGFPHVIYARLWRWPDLHKNELKHAAFCRFAFDLKYDSVCVNPYHYERVPAPRGYQVTTTRECDSPLSPTGGAGCSPGVNEVQGLIHMSPGPSPPPPQAPSPDYSSPAHPDTGTSPRQQTQFCFSSGLDFWCSISYLEQDVRVGEVFKAPGAFPVITVDGYMDPSGGDRFCLGRLSNVQRTEASHRARLHIGRGLQLEHRGDGDVWLRCLSDHAVFLQRAPCTRFTPGRTSRSVFDLRQCHREMQQATHPCGRPALPLRVPGQPCGVGAGPLCPLVFYLLVYSCLGLSPVVHVLPPVVHVVGPRVDALRSLCVFRVSLVKGWGQQYPRRCIQDTPCWLEVHLHRALQLLDQVLHALSPRQHRDL